MAYNQLTLQERHYIEIETRKGTFQTEIAKALNRSQGTISKEISRNKGGRGYRYQQANKTASQRHKDKTKSIKLTDEIMCFIENELKTNQSSPEQIAGRLKKVHKISLHHESIYRYILEDKSNGGKLYLHLRHKHKAYRKRYGSSTNSTKGIPDRVDIDQRPKEANDRLRVGDWEADTVIGAKHKGAIVTLDERVSKLRLALPQVGKFAKETKESIIELLKPFSQFVKTITFDNGKEFAKHMDMASSLGCDTYFAKPYHSWERGQNENANGLLRQYFPKGMEFVDITRKEVVDAVHRLNSRPRKCLDYATPYEAFIELTGLDARILVQGIRL
ncbi:MAG: IS30 family transposase [Sulfurovum sp.]|nr:MAG: IS30 family transposase [Sulfurovum sp.]